MVFETRIIAATVYPDRARVVRSGQIDLESGLYRLEVVGLPLQMQPESVRASAHGSAKAHMLGVQVRPEYYAETPAEAVRELEAQVESSEDQLSLIAFRTTGVEQARSQLASLAGQAELFAAALAGGDQTVDEQLALFERIARRTTEYDGELVRLRAEQRAAERRLKQLQAQLAQARSQRPPARYIALVEIEALQPGGLEVMLSYVVGGAAWKPLYDLRLDDGPPPQLEVGYLAQVTQNSGEEWKNIDLTLSTARPALTSGVPETTPWYIRPAPPPRPVPAAMPSKKMLMRADMAEEPAAQYLEATSVEEVVASVETSGAAVSYRIPGSVTIPPDGTSQKVVVARYDLQPKMDYVSAPALIAAVYRRARVTNASVYTLLPGAANLFARDEYLGAAQLELTPPQGEIELFLGVDDRLPVERELVRREVDKTLVGGRRRVRYGYEIRLQNRLDVAADLTVRDRYPVSRHEDLKVRLERVDPQPTRQKELNQMDWELNLKANEKRTLRYDFIVEHPAAMEVQGLGDELIIPF